jgi:hypothetical protein
MRNQARFVRIASTALLLSVVIGCGSSDSLPRQAVSGTVAVEGKPLDSGLVTFLPDDAGVATQGGAAIVAGKFSIPREGGLVPGKYKVSITAAGDTDERKVDTANNMPGMPPVPARDIIPKEYNSSSLLTAEVKAGSPNEFSFNLTATKKN